MIGFSMIVRTTDGLPLCATTDMSNNERTDDYQMAYKELKLVAKKSDKFPDRCSMAKSLNTSYSIHFISALGLTFLVLCDSTYPTVLAFSFLDEVQREFLQMYHRDKVVTSDISRPYSYISFDLNIQKIKHRYNNPRSLTTKLNLQALSQEMKLRPPYIIHPDTLQSGAENSLSSFRTAASFERHFVPLGLYGCMVVGLNVLCSFINLSQGVNFVNEAHIDDISSETFQYGAAFLLCFLFFSYQIYLILCPTSMRKPLACATLGSICLCQLYLWEFRTNIQLLFHVTVGCAATFTIFTRQIQEKLPQYNL